MALIRAPRHAAIAVMALKASTMRLRKTLAYFVDTRTEACGHRGDGTHSIHYAAAQDIGIFNPDAQGTVHSQ
jgi:hypothetical protein